MHRIAQIRKSWPILALCAFYVYLTFHALSGSQGIMRWVDYENDVERLKVKLEQAQAERESLEARTQALRTDNLSLDALDMEARRTAFLSHSQESVIWFHDTQ